MRLEQLTHDEWADVLPRSGVTPFHTTAALSVLDDHAAGTLRLLVGYNGRNPVACLPLFIDYFADGQRVTSPPSGFGIPALGPVLFPASPKQRKREQLNRAFTSAIIDEFDLDAPTSTLDLIGTTAYSDPRPFSWAGFSLSPAFSHRVALSEVGDDLSDTNGLFSDGQPSGHHDEMRITRGDAADAKRVFDQEAGSATNGVRSPSERDGPSWSFVRDLIDALDERARVYCAHDSNGTFLAGCTVLYSPAAAFVWQDTTHGVESAVGQRLHGRILMDIAADPSLEWINSCEFFEQEPSIDPLEGIPVETTLVPRYRINSTRSRAAGLTRVTRLLSRQ